MSSEIYPTVPTFKVEIDGSELSAESMAAVESVRFEEEINMASMFVLRLLTSDFEKGTWKFIDLKTFSLGREIKLYMGMDSLELMMVGEITSIEPSFGVESSTVEVRGYDRLHRLRFGKRRRTFSDMKDSDITSSIASDWGLSAEVKDTGVKLPYLYQNNQSDLEFLLDRAKRIRYELHVDDKKLFFKPAQENEPASLTLENRVDIYEFNVKLSTRYQGDEIKVQGWDYVKKDIISATAKSGNKVSQMSSKETGSDMTKSAFGASSSAVVDEYLVDASDAEKVAVARYNAHLVESVTGEGRGAGYSSLRAGKTVEITGVGRFEGIYYVTSTTHTIDTTGYNTSFKVRRVGV